jgi:hypothetical protein
MAECQDMQLNHVLCFLFSKLNKCDEKRIKTAILDYYCSADIHDAKQMFVNCVSTLSDIDSLSKIRDRRAGDLREKHELDDIFTVLAELDQKKMLGQLPKFVSDSSEKMPSSTIVDGDVRAIMNRFEKMELLISHLQSTVNKLSTAIVSQAPLQPAGSDIHSISASQPAAHLTDNLMNGNFSLRHQRAWADEFTSASSCDEQVPANDQLDTNNWQTVTGRRRLKRQRFRPEQQQDNIDDHNQRDQHGGSVNTANTAQQPASHSTNRTSNNRQDSSTFVVAHGRSDYAAAAARPGPVTDQRPRRQHQPHKIVGRSRQIQSTAASGNQGRGVAAAKPYISKATFCIDNVSTAITDVEMTKFVEAMDIDVLGCYKVKPRRTFYQRQHGIQPTGRNTFRLCIPREDTKRLLDPQKWPAHILITEWQFKKRATESDNNPRMTDSPAARQSSKLSPTPGGASKAAAVEPAAAPEDNANNDQLSAEDDPASMDITLNSIHGVGTA